VTPRDDVVVLFTCSTAGSANRLNHPAWYSRMPVSACSDRASFSFTTPTLTPASRAWARATAATRTSQARPQLTARIGDSYSNTPLCDFRHKIVTASAPRARGTERYQMAVGAVLSRGRMVYDANTWDGAARRHPALRRDKR
jgi:hypothetical protein